ncbi:hypothetical protein CMEL01_05097 [Colletotrichum melonis]|uniref:Uncharacterized protein n=1 Tax=Colletotrichum melonis TaxID=1209925 RepID=A0AAI9U7Y7_9PEZI|nr:hypothetical protein CMEL01_05097 [Colletotrichum melonis]
MGCPTSACPPVRPCRAHHVRRYHGSPPGPQKERLGQDPWIVLLDTPRH